MPSLATLVAFGKVKMGSVPIAEARVSEPYNDKKGIPSKSQGSNPYYPVSHKHRQTGLVLLKCRTSLSFKIVFRENGMLIA
jgi:hypothetical protein